MDFPGEAGSAGSLSVTLFLEKKPLGINSIGILMDRMNLSSQTNRI